MRYISLALLFICAGQSKGQLKKAVQPLVDASCIHCHDADTKTGLNLAKLDHNLSKPETFRSWVKVFDRVNAGEMPPKSAERPKALTRKTALTSLRHNLRKVNLARQGKVGRVPARRLTRREFNYTLHDLLGIHVDLTKILPAESQSGSFDTVGVHQRISAVHMQSYLKAADMAFDAAINLGSNPYRKHKFDFLNSQFLNEFHDRPLNLGGSITLKKKDGIALFADIDYLFRSGSHGYRIRMPGVYRITSQVSAYQTKKPLTAKLIVRSPSGNAKIVGVIELTSKISTFVVETFLRPRDDFYITFETGKTLGQTFGALFLVGGAKNYKGPGLFIKAQSVEGPLLKAWPPARTKQLFQSANVVKQNWNRKPYRVKPVGPPLKSIRDTVAHVARRAFRRPATKQELDSFVKLAEASLKEKNGFLQSARIPLRAILTSPQFLLMPGEPGQLNDHALATRLSYFLWKSLPDEELLKLAKSKQLSQPSVLTKQVERLLSDKKADRFVKDFVGQWLRLYAINATTPDGKLYPEYDELLGWSLPQETEAFVWELIRENLPVRNLIDSEFAFANRRLARHYGLKTVAGQRMQRVKLPKNSVRGGILTQAAILKTTANGTVTSPVTRGNFVLTSLLGTPPSPPPPGVGSIEPDTRGKTTIREILKAHRKIETCAKCHRSIDPPGFALESFDPIGGFRTNYRATATGFSAFLTKNGYRKGPKVDASGETSAGQKFKGIRQFKKLLLKQQDQVARNLISQLIVYSTGGEIEFADRDEIERIVKVTKPQGFRVRDIIHEVVKSRLFRHK